MRHSASDPSVGANFATMHSRHGVSGTSRPGSSAPSPPAAWCREVPVDVGSDRGGSPSGHRSTLFSAGTKRAVALFLSGFALATVLAVAFVLSLNAIVPGGDSLDQRAVGQPFSTQAATLRAPYTPAGRGRDQLRARVAQAVGKGANWLLSSTEPFNTTDAKVDAVHRRVAVGMLSACCSEKYLTRRNFHRRVFSDYQRGLVAGRAPLPADAVQLFFVIGHPANDPDFKTVDDEELRTELTTANDLLKLPFEDSYVNLYKKTDMWLAWATLHTDAQFIVKADDDCYINYRALLSFTAPLGGAGTVPSRVYTGGANLTFKPIRNEKSKWYVSEAQWSPECPTSSYAVGWTYLMSRDVAIAAVNVLRAATELALSDAYTASLPEGVDAWAVPELLSFPPLRGLPEVASLDLQTWDPSFEPNSTMSDIAGIDCSLNRIWFEDARVGIAINAALRSARGRASLPLAAPQDNSSVPSLAESHAQVVRIQASAVSEEAVYAGAENETLAVLLDPTTLDDFPQAADIRRQIFSAAWTCCNHETVAKHMDYLCKTEEMLPLAHTQANATRLPGAVGQCVHKDMGECGRGNAYIRHWERAFGWSAHPGKTCQQAST